MRGTKLSELPAFEGKDILIEAMNRGKDMSNGKILDGVSVVIIGLAKTISDMQKEIRYLKGG